MPKYVFGRSVLSLAVARKRTASLFSSEDDRNTAFRPGRRVRGGARGAEPSNQEM